MKAPSLASVIRRAASDVAAHLRQEALLYLISSLVGSHYAMAEAMARFDVGTAAKESARAARAMILLAVLAVLGRIGRKSE